MDAKHKITAQLLLKWQESLIAEDFGEIRAIQEEIAYIMRAKGCLKSKEFERIRLRFGLHSKQIDSIEAINHAAPVPNMNKRQKQAQLRLLRFCVHCDTEMEQKGSRFVCPNSKCAV